MLSLNVDEGELVLPTHFYDDGIFPSSMCFINTSPQLQEIPSHTEVFA